MARRLVLAGTAILAALALAPAAGAELDEEPNDAGFVVVGSRTANGSGIVRVRADLDLDGRYEKITTTFNPYPGSKVGDGVRVALGDFDGDTNDELVVAAGTGLPIKIFDFEPDGTVGALLESRKAFGKRGAFVAAGDLNRDGRDELIAGVSTGKPSTVRVWSDSDLDLQVLDNPVDSFNPFGGSFKGGVRVAAGDTNVDGDDELITATGPGGRRVTVWNDADLDKLVSDHPPVETFLAYSSSFSKGLFVAAGPIGGAGTDGAEVIVAPGSGKGRVLVYKDATGNGIVSDEPLFDELFAYGASWSKGVRVAAGDTDRSGFYVEIPTAPGASAGKRPVKLFDDDADLGSLLSDNPPDDSFIGVPSSVKAGAYVAFGRVQKGTYPTLNVPLPIPDPGTAVATIVVPPAAGIVRDLDVFLGISQGFHGDMDVAMTHVPSGRSIELFTDAGGNGNGFLVRLDDSAGTDIATVVPVTTDATIVGTFRPEAPASLSTFSGIDASGLWRLTVTDDLGGFPGTLLAWNLEVTY